MKGQQIDAWYSGKPREPGGNVQALSAPDGFPLWVSDVEPGSVHCGDMPPAELETRYYGEHRARQPAELLNQ